MLKQKFYNKEVKEGEKNMRKLSFFEDWLRDEFSKGRLEGVTQGHREANIATAKRMRNAGMNNNDIIRATNLSFEDIRSL